MALSAPVGLSGEDNQKCPFTMAAKATNLNRYGAAIHVARQLLVGSTVTVRNSWNPNSGPSGCPAGYVAGSFGLRN